MPVEAHHDFKPPSEDETTLWRYVDLWKLLSMFEDRALYFTRVDKLGDPFEGSYTGPTIANRRAAFAHFGSATADRLASSYEQKAEALRYHSFASCWHISDGESAALWQMYSARGVAISATWGRLKRALDGWQDDAIYVGTISYLDYETEKIPDCPFCPILHKRKSFGFEHEVRAVIDRSGLYPSLEKPEETGLSVGVDLNALIDRIHVAPQAEPWMRHLVTKLTQKYGLSCEVVHSAMDARPLF